MGRNYPRRENIGVLSTGDPEEDARQIEKFIIREKRLMEGLCSNGCAPMIDDGGGDSHCPECGFSYHQRTLNV